VKKLYRGIYLNNLIFYILTGIVGLFVVSHFFEQWFSIAKLLLIALVTFVLIDITILFIIKKGINATRHTSDKLSNGDKNEILITINNHYPFNIQTLIIDELPFQFQNRTFTLDQKIQAQDNYEIKYTVRPTERGEYNFGFINVYIKSPLRLISRRFISGKPLLIKTYPSYIQLKKYNLIAFSNRLSAYGLKKIRRIGHSLEFEQIKEYVQGDDLRTINWKASAKKNQLMINQFQDEKSQPVYSVIDKGRVMKMPFNGLSLLDYAINASLVLSNVVLKKQDKAGMFTFSKKVENIIVSERRTTQMNLILEALYNVKTNFYESDYSRLYADIKRTITHRSLIMLYTNFETLEGLKRQLPYLRAIAKNHMLIVVFFKNTKLDKIVNQKANTIQEVYDKVVAEKFIFEKKQIVSELKKYGINTILTAPENLSIDSINKYLEIKSRGIH